MSLILQNQIFQFNLKIMNLLHLEFQNYHQYLYEFKD